MKKSFKVAYVGLTHLGLNYLAASSEKGFEIVGVDINQNKIDKLNQFKVDYNEPNLQRVILKNKKNIIFSSNLKNIKNCQVVFISQDVSTDKKGKGDFNSLKKLIKNTSKFLNKKAIMVILSQVQPGFTRMINFDHNRLHYQVETLILGNALERALKPERFIIGCNSSESKINYLLLRYLYKFNCPIIKMNYESAELAKISINLLLSSSINVSNILAEVCEKINANWNEIVPALQSDKRIGKHAYLRAGLGISGGNLERDISSIIRISKKYKIQSKFFQSILSYSKKRKNWVWEKLAELGIKKKNNLRIAILGLTYKENTDSTKNSPAVELINKLIKKHHVIAYDPVAQSNIKSKNFKRTSSPMKAINKADIVILMTPWSEFKFINIRKLATLMRGKIIIDPFNILNYKKVINSHKSHYSLGRSN